MEENIDQVIEKNNISQDEKNFKRNKWTFCCGGVGRDMLYTLVGTYFLQYVQFGLTLSVAQFAVLSLMIGILGRIWDGINDPMMGAIIDGSHLKWGKFKPWILIGAVGTALTTLLLFNLRPTNGWLFVIVICAVYLLWEAVFTMNDIGYWSMIPSLSRTKERRDTITTYTIFFAGIGTIIMTGLVTLLSPGNVLNAYTLYSIIACVAIIGCQSLTTFGVKEAPRDEYENKDEKISFKRMVKTIISNKQLLWMSLAHLCDSAATAILLGLVYNMYYLEGGYNNSIFVFLVIYAVVNTLVQLFYPKLAKKYSRKKIELVSFIVEAIGLIGMSLIGWFNTGIPLIVSLCVTALFVFAGNSLFYIASVINLNNCVEYNEYNTGRREEAVVTTMRPLIVKFGDAIKYLIVTMTLIFSGLYAITQNISAIETQKSKFEKECETIDDARNYVQAYTNLKSLQGLGNDIETLETIADENAFLTDCQFDVNYLDAYGYLYVVREDTKGNYIDSIQLSNPEAITFVIDGEYKYEILITVTKDGKEIYNAADEIYSAKRDLGTRIIIRISCCIVPLLLMVASLLIQRRKFIIDEEYYDKITKEIEERKLNKEENKLELVTQE